MAEQIANALAHAPENTMATQSGTALKKPLSDLGYIWLFTVAMLAGLILAGVAAVLYAK